MASSVHEALTSFEILEPEYERLWLEAQIIPIRHPAFVTAKIRMETYKERYAAVEVATGIPWYFIGALHLREAALNFHAWFYNGDPMFDHNHVPCRTVHVPRGLPRDPHVSWEIGAIDALRREGLDGLAPWTPTRLAWGGEKFNGFGYRKWHHIPSPYLWGGTTVQEKGKYIKDGEFDPGEMDEQLGIMGIFKLILGEGTA